MLALQKLVGGCAAVFLALAGLNPVAAQQETEEKPKPAAHVFPLILDSTADQQETGDQGTHNLHPDNGPLTGVQSPTLGTPAMLHSYWVPGIQYSNTIRSN